MLVPCGAGADQQLEDAQPRAIAQRRQGVGRRLFALLSTGRHVISISLVNRVDVKPTAPTVPDKLTRPLAGRCRPGPHPDHRLRHALLRLQRARARHGQGPRLVERMDLRRAVGVPARGRARRAMGGPMGGSLRRRPRHGVGIAGRRAGARRLGAGAGKGRVRPGSRRHRGRLHLRPVQFGLHPPGAGRSRPRARATSPT